MLFAESVLAAQRDDRIALAACVRRLSVLGEHLMPRERVVLRALRRLVHQTPGNVYRERAQVVEETEANAVRDWVTRLVPRAHELGLDDIAHDVAAHTTASDADLHMPERTQREAATAKERLEGAVKTRQSSAKKRSLVLGIWVLTVMTMMAVFRFSPRDSEPSARSPGTPVAEAAAPRNLVPFRIVSGVGGVLLILCCFAVLRGPARGVEAVRRAQAQLASQTPGAADQGMRTIDAQARSRFPVTAAVALVTRAIERERRADFAGSLADCEQTLAVFAANRSLRVHPASLLHRPHALALRAFALAVLGKQTASVQRLADAGAVMAELEETYPESVHAVAHRSRVALILALAARDYERASRIAAARPTTMPIPYRDELLAELVTLSTQGNASHDAVHALLAEISENPQAQAWLEAVAPEVLGAVRARTRLA